MNAEMDTVQIVRSVPPMKSFNTTEITAHGKVITVEAYEVAHTTAAIRVVATIEDSTVTMTHVLGAEDGAHAPLPDDHVQVMLNNLRERAARACAQSHTLKTQMKNAV